jgi:cystathionine gamma-synthase
MRLVKGPSFGVRFSLACPFLYLAHYDLVSTGQGRRQLRGHGLEPDLVRLSVGAEPLEAIQEAIEAGWAGRVVT